VGFIGIGIVAWGGGLICRYIERGFNRCIDLFVGNVSVVCI
jgi:hypothetical protein